MAERTRPRRRRRAHVRVRAARTADARAAHHPERRARHPARQGRAVRRRPAADGSRRARHRSTRSKLAGAFGSHIDPVYALVLGMIPDCDPDKVTSVGNAAGSGAVRALLSEARPGRDRRRWRARSPRSRRPSSRASRSTSCRRWACPHTTDPYARLAAVVDAAGRAANRPDPTPHPSSGARRSVDMHTSGDR